MQNKYTREQEIDKYAIILYKILALFCLVSLILLIAILIALDSRYCLACSLQIIPYICLPLMSFLSKFTFQVAYNYLKIALYLFVFNGILAVYNIYDEHAAYQKVKGMGYNSQALYLSRVKLTLSYKDLYLIRIILALWHLISSIFISAVLFNFLYRYRQN